MTRNTNPLTIQLREGLEHRSGQFLRDVRVHVISVIVRWLGRVDVEARAGAEVIAVGFAGDVEAAYISSIHLVLFPYKAIPSSITIKELQ